MLMTLFVLFPAAGAVYLHVCSEQSYVKFKTQKVRLKHMCMHLIKVHYRRSKKIWQQRLLHYYNIFQIDHFLFIKEYWIKTINS